MRAALLVHAGARGLLIYLAAGLIFGNVAAYLAALCAASLIPYEAWCRSRERWPSRCLAVAGAWPLSAALAMGLPYHAVYAQTLFAGGWGRARQALGEGLGSWPADPPYSSSLTPWLEALPWHRPNFFFESYTVLETSTLLGAILTVVAFTATFLGDARSQAHERGWQALAGGVGGATLGLAAWLSHVDPVQAPLVSLRVRPDPLWLWAYLILIGTACPLAAVVSDWLTGLPLARSGRAPHTTPRGAARARS